MGNMNQRTTLAIVLSGLLVLGLSGAGALGAAATDTGNAPAGGAALPVVLDAGQNQTERIPITEAIAAAANRTVDPNATVVGAEFGQSGGILDFGDDAEGVYTVDVLMPNGTHVEVAVNATNGSVVRTQTQEEGFLEGIFGENEVPDRPLNLSALYNASEAVQVAQNVTAANATVTAVNLNQRDGTLVYEVEVTAGEGEESTVVVDARQGGSVIEVENGGAAVTTTAVTTTNATTTDGGG